MAAETKPAWSAGHACGLIKAASQYGHRRSATLDICGLSQDVSVSQPHPRKGPPWIRARGAPESLVTSGGFTTGTIQHRDFDMRRS